MLLRDYINSTKDLTVAKFGELIGKGRTTVFQYMNGEQEPFSSTARLIVKESHGKVSFEEVYAPFVKESDDESVRR